MLSPIFANSFKIRTSYTVGSSKHWCRFPLSTSCWSLQPTLWAVKLACQSLSFYIFSPLWSILDDKNLSVSPYLGQGEGLGCQPAYASLCWGISEVMVEQRSWLSAKQIVAKNLSIGRLCIQSGLAIISATSSVSSSMLHAGYGIRGLVNHTTG